ncbi:MAG: hypothetical protein COV52_03540 [Gammaproteobacteria bacterium CG11_big_fil_rev_8_21_14_0_20_46_22]|nr:MAG: hypothetical protein COW05_09805 [Gammaproteobacteria bacterium CG12_big_fil_rev_8_21_14_0_65_46_12]PIR11547.1 MAG: hypothetical protein COV52_03540 [Gammaproteobacteria bacterium CG11_big_fil_rev_8_21_14_0_20_46_22]
MTMTSIAILDGFFAVIQRALTDTGSLSQFLSANVARPAWYAAMAEAYRYAAFLEQELRKNKEQRLSLGATMASASLFMDSRRPPSPGRGEADGAQPAVADDSPKSVASPETLSARAQPPEASDPLSSSSSGVDDPPVDPLEPKAQRRPALPRYLSRVSSIALLQAQLSQTNALTLPPSPGRGEADDSPVSSIALLQAQLSQTNVSALLGQDFSDIVKALGEEEGFIQTAKKFCRAFKEFQGKTESECINFLSDACALGLLLHPEKAECNRSPLGVLVKTLVDQLSDLKLPGFIAFTKHHLVYETITHLLILDSAVRS